VIFLSRTSETSDTNYKFKIVSGKNYILTNDEKFANQFLQGKTTQMQTMPKKRGPYKKRQEQAEPEVEPTQKTRKTKTIAPLMQ
jgi:hypothetical protein